MDNRETYRKKEMVRVLEERKKIRRKEERKVSESKRKSELTAF